MNEKHNEEIPVEVEMPEHVVSVVPREHSDPMEEFPVLKAFQQYIDSEHEKARRRMLFISVSFGLFLALIVAVFLFQLMKISERNQELNDRLVDYAMKERERNAAMAAEQAKVALNSEALTALGAQMSEIRKNMEAEKAARLKAEKEAEEKAKLPSPQDLEIQELKKLLQVEKDKFIAERERIAMEKVKEAEEKAKKREAELDAYRRKQYPEFYRNEKSAEPVKKPAAVPVSEMPKKTPEATPVKVTKPSEPDDVDILINDLNNNLSAISYFDEDEEAETKPKAKSPAPTAPTVEPEVKSDYKIPVENVNSKPAKDDRWRIPNE